MNQNSRKSVLEVDQMQVETLIFVGRENGDIAVLGSSFMEQKYSEGSVESFQG